MGKIGSRGNRPSAMSDRRTRTRTLSLMSSARIVARPIGVKPTSVPPSHRKCFGQSSFRGLKSRVILPVPGGSSDVIRPLVQVALHAREGEVLGHRRAVMLAGTDVVEDEADRRQRFGEPAVLAQAAPAEADDVLGRAVHRPHHYAAGWRRFNDRRAFDWSNMRSVPAWTNSVSSERSSGVSSTCSLDASV